MGDYVCCVCKLKSHNWRNCPKLAINLKNKCGICGEKDHNWRKCNAKQYSKDFSGFSDQNLKVLELNIIEKYMQDDRNSHFWRSRVKQTYDWVQNSYTKTNRSIYEKRVCASEKDAGVYLAKLNTVLNEKQRRKSA